MKITVYVVGGFVSLFAGVTLIALVQDPPTGPALFALWVLFAIPTFGAFWMMYMAARYEPKPLSLILLSFIPFTSFWYYFERIRPREARRIRNVQFANENEKDQRRGTSRFMRATLLAIVALAVYAIALWFMLRPVEPSQTPFFMPIVGAVFVVPPIGGWWLIYMVIRYEKRVFPLLLLGFVPYGFVWYYFERVRSGTYKSRQLA